MILIIDKSLKDARVVSDIFHYMGVLAYAVTPEYALREISNRYTAVLICDPEELCEPEFLVKNLKELSLNVPIFAICQNAEDLRVRNPRIYFLFQRVFSDNTFSSSVYHEIIKYQLENDKPMLGEYLLAGIDVSSAASPTLSGKPIKLTKTETMILRYIIRSYPIPASAKDILKYAFKPSRTPEISNIRTHISAINRKLREINDLVCIVSEPRSGYIIPTFSRPSNKKYAALSTK